MPDLPPELWFVILRSAVYTPGILETESLHPWQDRAWLNLQPSNQVFDSVLVRRAICLVSKSWRRFGWQLLYEHIFISILEDGTEAEIREEVDESLVLLLQVLENSKTVEGAHPMGHGWWTKRLDIPVHSLHQNVFPKILTLLDLCPNVEVVSTHPMGTETEEDVGVLALALESRYSHSLRRIIFNTIRENRIGPIPPNLLLPRVALRTISICVDSVTIQSVVDPCIFADVTTLTIYLATYIQEDITLEWDLPSLRHLTMALITDKDVDGLRPFILRHGEQLSSMTIFSEKDEPIEYLDRLLEVCKNLEYLVLDPWDITPDSLEGSYASVKCLGLTRNTNDEWNGHFATLCLNFLTAFPGLVVVRTISYRMDLGAFPPTSTNDEGWVEWETVVRWCADRELKIEDER